MSENLKFYVFNIKLQSDKTAHEKAEAYANLIERLTSTPYKPFVVTKSEAIILYGSTTTKDNSKVLYLYGRAAKGFYVAGNERQVLKDGKVNVETNNPDVVINPIIVRYLFLPEAHRLFLEKKSGGPSQLEMERLLNETLRGFILPQEKLEIVLEKDENAIKEIFAAKVVHSLSYTVSYTNEDFLEELAEDFDKELKDTNIGELSVTATADNHLEGLKIETSKLLGGGLKLAENNGEIKRATITPNDGKGKKKAITNKNKPKVLTMKVDDKDNFWDRWYKNVLNLYRMQR